MSDQDDSLFQDICQEAHGLASRLNGDPDRIAEVWRGKEGLQHRIADALEPLLSCPAKYNRAYDEACQRVWAILWAGRL